jgi:hypothetical protein
MDITAPRLLYLSREKLVRAQYGLALGNPNRRFKLTGRTGTYDLANEIGVIDSLPQLAWSRVESRSGEPGTPDKSRSDSTRVTSTRMRWHERESRALAEGAVRLTSGVSELSCDTAVFLPSADSGMAWGKPEMRDSASHATGDTMTFAVRNGALERVAVRSRAAGEYRTQGGDEIQVAGRAIGLWFADGGVERIEVADMTSGRLVRKGQKAAAQGESKPQ